jgi:cysteine desulfurase
MKRIYLDYAATTPVDPKVVEFMTPYFSTIFGNSQSLHSFGQESSQIVEKTRDFFAKMLNCSPEEIIFTSGGTESNNTAIKGIYFANKNLLKKHFICSSIEHHAVLEPINFLTKNFSDCSATFVPVNKDGIVDIEQLFNSITKDTILISIMHANNEIGTIQPIKEIGLKLKEINSLRTKQNLPKIYFHTDAVQSFAHIKVDVEELGIDLLSLSGHKFYAPKGVGILYVRKGTRIVPLLHGGGHEFNKRASTVNHSSIAGFYKAAQILKESMEEETKRIKFLRDKLYYGIINSIKDVVINGSLENRLENNLNISFYGIESESLIVALDNEGIAVSSGSACSSGSTEPSHVILALGQEPVLARGSVRFSLGRYTTEEEIDITLKILPKLVEKFRKISPLTK